MKKALIIVDIQNDYFPGGAMPLEGSVEAGQQACKLLSDFRTKGLPVIHIQHISAHPGATFFLPDTPGVAIHDGVKPLPDEAVFQKHYPNSFRQTGLEQYLRDRGITELVICGMMTHMCIDTTVRAAFDLGFSCKLAHDACATRTLTFGNQTVPAQQAQTAYLAALNGMFADCRSTEELTHTA